MFARLRLLSATALITGLAITTPAVAQDAPTLDTVMASVGDSEITLGHMLALRNGLPADYNQLPPEVLFKGVLDQLIQQTLLMRAHEGPLSEAAKWRLENETRAVTAGDVIDRVLEAALTDEALQAAYDAQYIGGDEETEYKAAHILVESEDEAKALVAELEGGANFAALAQEHSTGPSGPGGGDLGWFSDGVMVQEFFDAVAKLEPGQVSPPVQTQFGWHVIKLNETRVKERPSLNEVRDELADGIRQEAFDAYVANLEDATEVTRTDISAYDPALINNTTLLEK
ncbi:putative parvulin-type peptidyl-prolyl cis-trans isomerase precursor [Roseovarius gaetbuli]|uniref:Parvulin-like PPIase n=1 Tax=Roseovarius gaetbuli TaxID=1356575 RepID=A0A1X7A5D3_9RHOB|nr:peptidylprolyl isomerase [Roseovarius gaetbuli]SLN69047.1 putative parvulin-type peptidyl-prolyl cis-trans isomerase precursor [Roseovarius gaetbuli]